MILSDGTSRKGIWKYKVGSRYEKGDLIIKIDEHDNVTLASVNPDSSGVLVASDFDNEILLGLLTTYYDQTVLSKSSIESVINDLFKWYLLDESTEAIEAELQRPIGSVQDLTKPGLYKITDWINGLPSYQGISHSVYRVYLKNYRGSSSGENYTQLLTLLTSPVNFNKSQEVAEMIINYLINNPNDKICLVDYADQTSFDESGQKASLDSMSSIISYEGDTINTLVDLGQSEFIGYIRVSTYSVEGIPPFNFYEFLDFVNRKYFITDTKDGSFKPWTELTGSFSQESALVNYIQSAESIKDKWDIITNNYRERIKYEVWVPTPGEDYSYLPFGDNEICYLFGLKVEVSINGMTFNRKYSIKIDKDDVSEENPIFYYDEYGSHLDYNGGNRSFIPGTGVSVTSKYKGYK
jgi:hypothetical protein